MPRKRFFNLAPEARARLLGIATAHIAKLGFERASLNEILTEAGVSKGSYYYYFEDKDDLFATTLESAIDGMLARLPVPAFDTLTRDDFWPAVERFVENWSAAFGSSTDLVQAGAQLSESQRKNPRFAPLLEKGQAIYRMLIEHGRRLGCIRTDLPVGALVRLLEVNDAALDAIFFSTHAKVTPATLDKHFHLVFDTFKRLLIVEPSSKSRATTGKPRRRG